jgi:hypothetical protein
MIFIYIRLIIYIGFDWIKKFKKEHQRVSDDEEEEEEVPGKCIFGIKNMSTHNFFNFIFYLIINIVVDIEK